MVRSISPRQFHSSEGIDDWRVVADGVCAYFQTGSFAAGARLVSAIGALPGLDAHHPDVDVRHDGVTVRLVTITHDDFGLTERDLELARQISAIARDLGIPSDPSAVQTVFVTIDALDLPAVMAFWRALLGYVDREDSPEDLIDPRSRNLSLWFQQMDVPRPERNRIHVDIWVPHDQAEARVAAALAAGGRVVTDRYAPSWWVLADPEGNEACIGSWLGRDRPPPTWSSSILPPMSTPDASALSQQAIEVALAEVSAFGVVNDPLATERSMRMLNITPDTGQLLRILVRSSEARRILEVGTSNGYSTMWLAWAASEIGGHVTTLERLPEKVDLARANFERTGLAPWITVRLGIALETLATLDGPFDLIFLDADRSSYLAYLDLLLPLLKVGGLLVTDNVVSHAGEITEFLARLKGDPSLYSVTVPVGNGEELTYKRA